MAENVKATARAFMKGHCRVCPQCNGRACAGEVPGMGGLGTGSAFQNNFDALRAVTLNMTALHGVKAPDTYAQYFTADKPFQAVKKEGKVQIKDNNITLSAQEGAYALADMGTRAPSMTLECDVTIDAGGRAGFAFGGSEADETYTVLAMDAGEGLIRSEGYEIPDLAQFPAQAFTRFDFSSAEVHHVKLVCENEIVVCYIDDTKALSSRISHSTGGAHIGVFSDGCGASFQNITVKLPE